MRILVTFAVDAEFAPWRKLRDFVPQKAEGLKIWHSVSGDTLISVLLTGMGDKAANSMELLMRAAAKGTFFDVCISSGLAGALCSEYRLGDVVVARLLKSPSTHANVGQAYLEGDPELLDLAVSLGAKPVPAFLTSDQVLTKATQKMALAAQADVVEMESFDILKEGVAWGARGLAIRGISDLSDEDLPIDFNRTISSDNDISISRVLMEVAKDPSVVGPLIRFGRQSRHAAQALCAFLESYVSKVGELSVMEGPSAVAAR